MFGERPRTAETGHSGIRDSAHPQGSIARRKNERAFSDDRDRLRRLCTEGDGLISLALGDYHGDIVLLFMRAELPNLFCQGGKQGPRRQITMFPQGFDKALFSELFSCIIERFGHAIGVEHEGVSWREMVLPNGAIPPFGQSQDSAVGFKLSHFVRGQKRKRVSVYICKGRGHGARGCPSGGW